MKCRLCRDDDALLLNDQANYLRLCLCEPCQKAVYRANIQPLVKAGMEDQALETCDKIYGWPKSLVA